MLKKKEQKYNFNCISKKKKKNIYLDINFANYSKMR